MSNVLFTRDWQQHTSGNYKIYNNVWGCGTLKNGVDYTQTISFDPLNPTQSLRFSWSWGEDHQRVLAYPEIIVGWSPLQESGSDSMAAQVSDIKTFDLARNVDYGGDTGLFNISYDIWITDELFGDRTTINTELMIWAAGGRNVNHETGNIVGSYQSGDFLADIYVYARPKSFGGDMECNIVSLIPRKDYAQTTFDVADILKELVRRGIVESDDYVSGYEIGTEIRGGSGYAEFSAISHTLETYSGIGQDAYQSIVGTNGADKLIGEHGDDMLAGKRGNDRLIGGFGVDELTGGGGRDRFVLDFEDGNADHITDFRTGHDKIILSSKLLGVNQTSKRDIMVELGASNSGDFELVYDQSSGHLTRDLDGAGDAFQPQLLAVIENMSELYLSDIILL